MRLPILTATPSSIRKVNRSIILELIRRRQPVSRAELARLTGIFRSSVSDIVDELVAENLVTEEKGVPSQRGRVPFSLRLNDAAYPVLGLNIRPAYSQIAWAGLSGDIQATLNIPTPRSPSRLVQAVAECIERMREQLGMPRRDGFRSMGIAVPGHADAATGTILWTPTHKELNGFAIADEIYKHTGVPALVDNDCNLGALSELWLSTKEEKDRGSDFVFLNISDFGAGAGALIDGEIFLGHDTHFAGEVGHMVVEPEGELCGCGRHGCWERYVCNEATWRRVHPRTPFSVERFEEMLKAARQGNSAALASIHETAKYLSLGVSNIGFIFNPSSIAVAGRITAIWDVIEQEVQTRYGSHRLNYVIRPARLSADDSLLHGAVCLAVRDVFTGPKFGETSALYA